MPSSAKTYFALVDCDGFYVSCERVFNRALMGQPVVVLSNNDGCVVSRSQEAKDIGIQMGEPVFRIRELLDQYQVHVYSSNYALYGDMSHRVMETLAHFSPDLEVYSIDEAFLKLTFWATLDLMASAQMIHRTVKRWTGIPVSIGLGPTKVLAKVATWRAKRSQERVYVLPDNADAILEQMSVGAVWGIGRRWARSLHAQGITQALQLRDMDLRWARRRYSVIMERLILELRGISCLSLELARPDQKSIQVSRSFGTPVTELQPLKAAIATYVSRAAEKLRSRQLEVSQLQVFARTNPFQDGYYRRTVSCPLPQPTQDTRILLQYSMRAAEAIFQPHQRFKKAGVYLLGLTPASSHQLSLLTVNDDPKAQQLMNVIDGLNHRFGCNTVQFGVAGSQKPWAMLCQQRSPRYTSCWNELPTAMADCHGYSSTSFRCWDGSK